MSATPIVSPGNNLAFVVRLKQPNASGGTDPIPNTSVVSAYLANSPTATSPPDPALVASVSFIAGPKWLVEFSGADLTDAVLDSAFANATPWLVVEQVGGIRAVAKLAYRTYRQADVI
jgi:hypothetical protein